MKNALKPKAAPVRGQPFQDFHRARGLSRVVDAKTVVAYDPATLFSDPTTELTFEELRAARWLEKHGMTMDDFTMVRIFCAEGRCVVHHPQSSMVPRTHIPCHVPLLDAGHSRQRDCGRRRHKRRRRGDGGRRGGLGRGGLR